MNGKFLLDTNIVIALLAGDPAVLKNLTESTEIFIPSIVAGELFYGAFCSQRITENINKIQQLIDNTGIIDCDLQIARQYGEIKSALKTKGRPLPENDIWIAAMAMRHSLNLVSRDQHFQYIEGLLITEW